MRTWASSTPSGTRTVVSDGTRCGSSDVQLEPHRLEPVPQHLGVPLVALEAGLETLLDHEPQPLAQRVHERRRDRVVVGVVAVPVAVEQVQVEIPGVRRPLARLDRRDRERARA